MMSDLDLVIYAVKETFDATTVDAELWNELDHMDDGERINVPITVLDLKRIRKILRGQFTNSMIP